MTRSFRQFFLGVFVMLCWPLNSHAQAPEKCVHTISELKQLVGDETFALKWEETTMDDGKPLVVSIFEKNGGLSVNFVKSTKGLWASIAGEICKVDKGLEIRFTSEQIQFGPAASWVLRYVLGKGGAFQLTRINAKQMRVASSGWDGIFVPVDNQ